MPSINYVIACWSGKRRGNTPELDRDDLFYLRNHVESLKQLDHDLTQITICVPYNQNQSINYTNYLDSLPDKIGNASVVVFNKENYGQSYGSYHRTFEKYRQEFDYYIFMEDDYCFVENNFDRILVDRFDSITNCGYLCSLVLNNEFGLHAALSNGITSSKILEEIYAKLGVIPHSHVGSKAGYDTGPQVAFSRGFTVIGKKLEDLTYQYRAPYNHLGRLIVHAQPKQTDFIVPIQFKNHLLKSSQAKIQILLLYYERPNMVRNALESIKNLNYTNWELAFIDDGLEKPGRPVVESILGDHLSKIKFYTSGDSIQKKESQGGSLLGKYMNKAMSESNAEICVMLCDDDALESNYLTNLNAWFKNNPQKMYCYSHVILFDPFKDTPGNLNLSDEVFIPSLRMSSNRINHFWNKSGEFNCANQVDAAQVAWRRSADALFPFPRTKNLDAVFYSNLFEKYGAANFSGFVGQYKAIYGDALDTREEIYLPKDLP